MNDDDMTRHTVKTPSAMGLVYNERGIYHTSKLCNFWKQSKESSYQLQQKLRVNQRKYEVEDRHQLAIKTTIT